MNFMRLVRFGVLSIDAGSSMQVILSFKLSLAVVLLDNLKDDSELVLFCLTKPWYRISGDADKGIGSTGFLILGRAGMTLLIK
jgi:hypothetical protein